MIWKIEVTDKPGIFDAVGAGVLHDIDDLNIHGVSSVRFSQIYFLEGAVDETAVKKICQQLLTDPVTQEFTISSGEHTAPIMHGQHVVEVAHNPGVMDPVEASALKGINDLGIDSVTSVRTAKKFVIQGDVSSVQLKTISEKLLYNKLIQHIVTSQTASGHTSTSASYRFCLTTVDLLQASDKKLAQLSSRGQLFLNVNEMRQIRNYFKKHKRNPTDCELETIAQTWSEHCAHKTFRGKINFSEKASSPRLKVRTIDNLLKSTIAKATKELKKPWCVSVFKDNAGVIRFDEHTNICFKVETHNHPSALEPFGGANTGLGGVIRDPLGTGLGAKPILNTDVFCFAPPDYPFGKLPQGSLHPKRVMKGVVAGVRDYGNKMGIPTVNGAVLFDNGFVGNPLVYCGTVGIMPNDTSFKHVPVGDLVVVVGGRTGRDGIHGATFSSGELTHESEVVSSGAVQIGNPIQEKKMVETIIQARDKGLYDAITDCGAGGLSSAVGEMGVECGARVDLDKVPLKYAGLSYTEIWISESQERMVLAVPPAKLAALIEVFSNENVEATVIGEFTDTKRLELYYNGTGVCDLEMKFMHDGLPQIAKTARYVQTKHAEPHFASSKDLTKTLTGLLSNLDICSKEWIIRQYDHEVQGASVLKPLCGILNDGPSDAAVVRPLFDSSKGIIVSNGINFRLGLIDPYWMAVACVDEALRQIIAVGGSLAEVAVLDNFCWGNPDKPDRLGGLVRAAYGCYDAAKGFRVPFISGKDSLYNEYSDKGKLVAIPGTLLISAIGVMDDVSKVVSMYAKRAGDLIYVVGLTREELGGSHYYQAQGFIGNSVPKVDFAKSKKVFDLLSKTTQAGLVASLHDCSEGGIAVAACEMAFAGGLGMDLFVSEIPYELSYTRNDFVLFSESNSRFIVEVERKNQKEFEKILTGIPYGLIGCVTEEKEFVVHGLDGKPCIKAKLADLKEAWQKPLRW
ncbi:MAG TPA: phosphoribosylformylglycinamidine synthase subunit PurL [Candidatus Omnitrophota bacterium]|nr:phosphoribosylformylglycinamidine synthase subunit PurL [Candidatus Omnitrophota bacterium]